MSKKGDKLSSWEIYLKKLDKEKEILFTNFKINNFFLN